MIEARLPLVLLGGALWMICPAKAQTLPSAAGESPPQAQDSAAGKAAAKKPAPKKAKSDGARSGSGKSDGLTMPSSPAARGSARNSTEGSPMRRIDPDDIADPYGGIRGGSGSNVKPMMTPSGRAGLGGRF